MYVFILFFIIVILEFTNVIFYERFLIASSDVIFDFFNNSLLFFLFLNMTDLWLICKGIKLRFEWSAVKFNTL